MRKKKNDYFEMLAEMASYCSKAALMLEDIMENYDLARIEKMTEDMHEIEHDADRAHHRLIAKLSTEFITPIEREDIAALGDEIDDVVDSLEDIVLRLHIFDVKELRDEAHEFAKILVEQNKQLEELMKEFKEFKKSKTIRNSIVEINRLEEVADKIYFRAIRRLYTEEKDAVKILKWTEIFRRMEGCCDYIEDVSQVVETVIMKNS